METKEKMVNNAAIYRPDDVWDKMYYNYKNGVTKGETTHNAAIDNAWTWRKQEGNIWTGYANEGKSLMLKQFCLAKSLNDKWRFAISAPEDYPPEDFYDDMIHTLTGFSTDKDNSNYVTDEYYRAAFDLIKDSFVFVYLKPPNNTIRGVLEEFRKICKEEQIDGCIIDPLIKFARPKNMERDDLYASYIGSIFIDFCRDTNTSAHLIMHQVTPVFDDIMVGDEKKRRYAEPSMYRVKGGGSWADGFDNVLSVWRPNYAFNKEDTSVQFSSQKIKKQKLVGIPQKVNLKFDRKTNRYEDAVTGYPLFDFDKFLYDK